MPQISQLAATYASQIFWLLLTFGLVFFVVGRGMLPKVLATIDSRDASIAGDLAAATAARDAADKAETAWHARDLANREAAQAVITAARAQGVTSSEATLTAAGTEISAKIAAGEAAIQAASAQALAEIENIAAEAAQDIVARLSGVTVSAGEATTAVKAVLHD